MDKLLAGRGNKQRIVATESVRGKDNIVEVFIRGEDDTVTSEYIPYRPYCYISSDDAVTEKFYDDTETQQLLGSNPLDLMVYSDTHSFLKWVENNASECYVPFRQSQWMLQSGNTGFKGMDFDDPLRLYFDLEVLTKKGYDFSNSTREEDKITLIAVWTNRGDAYVLALNDDGQTPKMDNVYRCKDETTLIEKFVRLVNKVNPDILCNHMSFGFDFPYLRDRAQMLGVKLSIGRDGSEPYTFNTSIKFAEKSDDYENFLVYGRHVLDTYFFAKKFDQVARTLDSLSLKECVKHLGKASDERTYIEGDDIADVWRGEHPKWTREDLIRYAIDDVKEAQILDREWGAVTFVESQMFPLPMQDVARYGTGNKIDLLFLREYYHHGWSLPLASPQQDYGGGYVNRFVYGYVSEPSIYVDVSSLYPTNMEILNIQPPKDELGLFQPLLKLVRELRFTYKTKYKQLESEGETRLAAKFKAMDGAVKITLNSLYGWLSWQWGMFNYYEGAAEVTKLGREIIKHTNKVIHDLGGKVIATDTDGSLTVPPEKYRGNLQLEQEFVNLVEDRVNEWLTKHKEDNFKILLNE